MCGIFPTIIDYTPGLMKVVQKAVGERNFCNISPNITSENFKFSRSGVWEVSLELIPCLKDWETKENAVKRLIPLGFTLENIGELAALMASKPDEVEKYHLVLALGDQSKWQDSDGYIRTPGASVDDLNRHFGLYRFDKPLLPNDCILVSRQARPLSSGLATVGVGEW